MRHRSLTMFLAVFCLVQGTAVAQKISNVEGNPIPGVPGYGVTLGLNGPGDVAALLVYHGTDIAQELVTCTPQPVPRSGNIGTIATTDFNFDGYGDLLLQVSSKNDNAMFCIWLFDPKTKQYVASPALSQLVNPTVDPKTKTVIAHKNLDCGSCYDQQSYTWNDGQLTMIRQETLTENIYAPTAGYTGGCSFVRSIKELRNGQLIETSRDRVNAVGTRCAGLE